MPFSILQGDVTRVGARLIVNPTDPDYSGSGGLDRQIHHLAGPELARHCAALPRLDYGRAVLTPAFELGALAVIHTAAPVWTPGGESEALLRSCYRESLALVRALDAPTVALPLIGTGTQAYPRALALRIAQEEIRAHLALCEDSFVTLVIHDRSQFQPDPELCEELGRHLDSRSRPRLQNRPSAEPSAPSPRRDRRRPAFSASMEFPGAAPEAFSDADLDLAAAPRLPEEALVLDESFSQMVLRLIREKGFEKDSDCYLRANLDRKHFSKIRCNVDYHPKKSTALALAVALRLSLPETRELLMKAGYTLSPSILGDVIVEYCLSRGIYDIFTINDLLFEKDQTLLG